MKKKVHEFERKLNVTFIFVLESVLIADLTSNIVSGLATKFAGDLRFEGTLLAETFGISKWKSKTSRTKKAGFKLSAKTCFLSHLFQLFFRSAIHDFMGARVRTFKGPFRESALKEIMGTLNICEFFYHDV